MLDEQRQKLYVLTRFDNSISVIDTASRSEVQHLPMHNPEPPSVTQGRRFFYDASFSSSHGDSACASCHVFGDFDSLAWDLGNPDAFTLNIPGPFIGDPVLEPIFAPMKGPMATQSLRGMANHGPMHWRGDRTAGNEAPSVQPDSGTFDEVAAFKKFQASFVDTLGRNGPIPDADMEAFAAYILQVTYPPNPLRNLDNSLTPDQQAGSDFFNVPVSSTLGQSCAGCHVTDPNGNPNASAPGFFGTDGRYTFAVETQIFKVPHLRNAYQKVGMFGMSASPVLPSAYPTDHQGDQVRGFGFNNEGGIDTLFRFLAFIDFEQGSTNPDGFPQGATGELMKRQVEEFMLVMDSNMKPIVGQQVTLRANNGAVVGPRIHLLIARANAGDCDLVVKGYAFGREVGFLYTGGAFHPDKQEAPSLSDASLRSVPTNGGSELTYTCVPPGSGRRVGIDRDADGVLDGDEL